MSYALSQHVFFVGFMGAGKTSVALQLAQLCGLDCVDADAYLEQREGRSISAIFSEQGEGFFRDLESKCLKALASGPPCLISCGGGVVERSENRTIIEATGFVVYLMVSVEEAARRIPCTDSRPLFADGEAAGKLLARRSGLYEAVADVAVNTEGRSVDQLACALKDMLEKAGVLSASA